MFFRRAEEAMGEAGAHEEGAARARVHAREDKRQGGAVQVDIRFTPR